MSQSSTIISLFLLVSVITLSQSVALRTAGQSHNQLSKYADVINNSNHV